MTAPMMMACWCDDELRPTMTANRQKTRRRPDVAALNTAHFAAATCLFFIFCSSRLLVVVDGLNSRMQVMAARGALHEELEAAGAGNPKSSESLANVRQARIDSLNNVNGSKPERKARVLPFRGGGYGDFQSPYMTPGAMRNSPFGQLQQPQFDQGVLGGAGGGGVGGNEGMSIPFGGGAATGGVDDGGQQMMGGGAGGGFDPSTFGGGGGGGGGGADGGLGGAGGQILPPPPGLLDRIRNGGLGGFPNQMMMPGGGRGGPPFGGGMYPPGGAGGGMPFGPPPMGGGGGGDEGGPLPGRANFPLSFGPPGGPNVKIPHPDCDYNPEQGPRDCRRSKLSPFLCLASEKYPNTTAKYIAKMYDDVLKQHAYPDLDVADIYDGDRPANSKKQETICDSEVLIIRPGYAINTEGQWRAVFQSDEFVQRLRVETCSAKCGMSPRTIHPLVVTPHRQPKKPCKHIPGCHASECAQKYAYIRLLSFDTCNKEAGPTYSMYRVPTACECRLMDEKTTVGEGDYGPMFNGGAAQNIQSTVKEMAKYGASGGDPKPAFA